MALQINLRKNNPTPLSVTQGDESLEHLGKAEIVTGSRNLYTGGEYIVTANCTLTLPADGNKFALTVQAGAVTFAGGTIENVLNAVEQGPDRKLYAKVANDWKVLNSIGATTDFRTVTSSSTLKEDDAWIWADSSSAAVTLIITAGLPSNKTFYVVRRGANSVTVGPTGGEGIIDPDTGGSNPDGVEINKDRGVIMLKRSGTNWAFTPLYSPT